MLLQHCSYMCAAQTAPRVQHAFWSMTMYALPQLLVANPIDRYLIQLADEARFAS
jgi:hypothetical protein